MIVDTSALIAVLTREPGHEALFEALVNEQSILPAPARLEFLTVARGPRHGLGAQAEAMIGKLMMIGLDIAAWTNDHAAIAAAAQPRYGKGNGAGGLLNIIDLMVYAVAIERDAPVLFTGRDFATTDVKVHPASRIDPVSRPG